MEGYVFGIEHSVKEKLLIIIIINGISRIIVYS